MLRKSLPQSQGETQGEVVLTQLSFSARAQRQRQRQGSLSSPRPGLHRETLLGQIGHTEGDAVLSVLTLGSLSHVHSGSGGRLTVLVEGERALFFFTSFGMGAP